MWKLRRQFTLLLLLGLSHDAKHKITYCVKDYRENDIGMLPCPNCQVFKKRERGKKKKAKFIIGRRKYTN
jgi:hypothetical protein